jgi:multidrug resistance efflux pump
LIRQRSKETLQDQTYKIAELKAEADIRRSKKGSELEIVKANKTSNIEGIEAEIARLKKELEFKKSLTEGLKSLNSQESNFKPIQEKIAALELEKKGMIKDADLKINALENELKIGNNPYWEQVKRLDAELQFDESQQIQHIEVLAPSDGLIGTISCKEEEHVPSFKTLLTFYEPHSGIIKGYVHEDMTLEVNKGDLFEVSSLKDETIFYRGKVIGLGSRIVEIPNRLRKIPELKTYGREVLIEITKDNQFLQKEKVGIRRINVGE